MPDWSAVIAWLGKHWAVIWSSLPVFLPILAVSVWLTFLATKKFYAQEVTNAKGLQGLAEKERDIAKAASAELEKKLVQKSPPPTKTAPPLDVVGVITTQPAVKEAFLELVSTHGLHLPVDPRPNDTRLFVALSPAEIERMAAARYFMDRGLVGVYKQDAMGTGVTVTGSSTAVAAYSVVTKTPDGSTGGSGG